jgi:hypothetical protein
MFVLAVFLRPLQSRTAHDWLATKIPINETASAILIYFFIFVGGVSIKIILLLQFFHLGIARI